MCITMNRFSRSGTYYAPNPPAEDGIDEMQHMVQYIRGLPYSEGPEVCMHAATALVHYILYVYVYTMLDNS
jgi:hypothetical protein